MINNNKTAWERIDFFDKDMTGKKKNARSGRKGRASRIINLHYRNQPK